jgi:MOSC domain
MMMWWALRHSNPDIRGVKDAARLFFGGHEILACRDSGRCVGTIHSLRSSRPSTLLSRSVIQLAVVNVATPTVLAETRGENVWSAIRKQPVTPSAVLRLSGLNLAGDRQADLSVHGGVDKAVYAYPSEHLGLWSEELDDELGPAPFGENLSTVGVLERDVRIGDVWSWGTAVLQVSQPRWPCRTTPGTTPAIAPGTTPDRIFEHDCRVALAGPFLSPRWAACPITGLMP